MRRILNIFIYMLRGNFIKILKIAQKYLKTGVYKIDPSFSYIYNKNLDNNNEIVNNLWSVLNCKKNKIVFKTGNILSRIFNYTINKDNEYKRRNYIIF